MENILTQKPLLTARLSGCTLLHSGKVRDVYDAGGALLLVSTDRLSAFDVVMNQGVPGKGALLNAISEFFFRFTSAIAPNHLLSVHVDDFPPQFRQHRALLHGRAMLCRKVDIIPLECIVRGYLSGTAWQEYKTTGSFKDFRLPAGLKESDKLPEPLFTPSTKAPKGEHDQNIGRGEAVKLIGADLFSRLQEICLGIYNRCAEYAAPRGIIIADTKLELGITPEGDIMVADELMTPDSSRFWDAASYSPGRPQNSFDKQFVRDFLIASGFNRQPPPPDIPEEIIARTAEKYAEAYNRLCA